jgi:hypothetical protein
MSSKLTYKATVPSRAAASSFLKEPGDAVIVDRQGPRWLILACPCGCGSEIPVNLDPRAGPAWRLYQGNRGLSVYPSVWRDTDCESHFIILRSAIFMLGSYHDELWFYENAENEEGLEKKTLARLSSSRDQSYEEISVSIDDSIPWDVLRCCRKLCRKRLAVEGRGKNAGRFRKTL